ncbi:MAG: hypothetical protein ACLTZY_15160 [Alistipes indistinctus]
MESSLKNMILTLLTITLVASLAVGVVYRVTAGPIAEAKAAKITQAIAKVLLRSTTGPEIQYRPWRLTAGK